MFLEASVLLSVKHINIMAALRPLSMSSSKGKLITYLAMDAETYDLMAVSYLPRNQEIRYDTSITRCTSYVTVEILADVTTSD